VHTPFGAHIIIAQQCVCMNVDVVAAHQMDQLFLNIFLTACIAGFLHPRILTGIVNMVTNMPNKF
jgi:hypothetical protein